MSAPYEPEVGPADPPSIADGWPSHERFLAEAGRALGQSLDYQDTLARVARVAVPTFADWCFIDLLTDEEQNSFERVAVGHARADGEEIARALRRRYPLRREESSGVSVAMLERKPSLVREVDAVIPRSLGSDAEYLAARAAVETRSCLIAPMVVRARVVGALSFVAHARSYGDEDLRFAAQLAHLAGAAIDNSRLFEAERRARVQLGRLLEVTAALSGASTTEQVAEVVCRLGAEALGAASAALWLAQPDGSLLLSGQWGTRAELVREFRSIAADTPVPAMEVLHTGEPLWVETAADYQRVAPGVFDRVKQAAGLAAYGAVPISLDHRVGGVLVFTHALEHRYDATERAFFGTLAQHCSQALHRARLLDTERRRLASELRSSARARLLSAVGETLALTLKVEEKLQVIAKLLVPELADWCVMDLLDGQDIRRVATEHSDPDKVERALRNAARYRPRVGDGSAIARVIELGKPHFFPRVPAETLAAAARDPEELEYFRSEPVVSVIVMPLIAGGQCIGALSLATAESGRVYEQDDVAFARELTRRSGMSISNARLRTALETERAKLRTVFEQAPFPLGVFEGPEHRIVLANSRWESLVRRPLTVGEPLGDAVPELREQNILPMHDRAFAGETIVHEEMPLELMVHGKPNLHYFHVVMQPLRNAFGSIDGHVTMALDVTERKLARLELESARRAAEAANRAKDEFLAMLGHELRNPLAPIVTALELMELQGAAYAAHERSVIARQVQHLTRLVDDLLDVSRVAKGRIELNTSLTELSQVVARTVERTSPLFEERHRSLEVDVPELGLLVEVDVPRMTQALSNLVTNAAKYSDVGGRVSISALRVAGEVQIVVADDGIGIRPEMLGHIFDLFVQEQQPSDRLLGGMGLGLAIVKSVVTLHGGSVAAESEGPGSGSRFTIVLPLATASLQTPAREPKPIATPTRGQRILVVDDNQDAAELLTLSLEAAGHVVHTSFEGPAALLALKDFRPDAAVLDIGLPGMDGYELAKRIREEHGPIRLIALTGYGQPSDLERSRAAGFDVHLVKPVELRLVLGALQHEPVP